MNTNHTLVHLIKNKPGYKGLGGGGGEMERERKRGREKSTEFLNGLFVFIYKI